MTRYTNIEKQHRNTRRNNNQKPCLIAKCRFNNSVLFIRTNASHNPVKQDCITNHQAHLLHQHHKAYVKSKQSALAGAVLDDKLKKMASC